MQCQVPIGLKVPRLQISSLDDGWDILFGNSPLLSGTCSKTTKLFQFDEMMRKGCYQMWIVIT
jgi:hypothetical protein